MLLQSKVRRKQFHPRLSDVIDSSWEMVGFPSLAGQNNMKWMHTDVQYHLAPNGTIHIVFAQIISRKNINQSFGFPGLGAVQNPG